MKANKWVVVTRIIDRPGKMPSARMMTREAEPDDFGLPTCEETERCDIYRDFFDTEAEAREFISENR